MNGLDILIIVAIVVVVVVFGLYTLNRWAYKKMDQQNAAIEQHKMKTQAYIISKKRDKITNVNMPKTVMDQVPKWSRAIKMNFVQCKIGPQILTLICDKNVYEAIPLKKNVKIELAGIYIVGVAGMKTPEEMKQIKKEKKKKEREEKKKK